MLEQGRVRAACPALGAASLLCRSFDGAPEDRALEVRVLDDAGSRVSENIELFDTPAAMRLTVPNITVDTAEKDGVTTLTLRADRLCVGVSLECGDCRFDDNWFALFPDEPREVVAETPLNPVELKVRSIR